MATLHLPGCLDFSVCAAPIPSPSMGSGGWREWGSIGGRNGGGGVCTQKVTLNLPAD